ncbi:hypothetical protein [Prochlorococcus sp. MIT 1011]|uniref:hypothetical protein n=1 Tax=Prochlorococcus sp. MIT 1011 TaxID=3082520 RepID=UPI0039B58B9B
MKRSLFVAICLFLFPSLIADAFDEIDAKTQCDKWVNEGGSYLIWEMAGNTLMAACTGNGK